MKTTFKKHVLVPIVITMATFSGYVGYRLKGHPHAVAVDMINELKASKGL